MIQPIRLGPYILRGNDLNLITTLDRSKDRLYLMIDLGPNCTISDIGMNIRGGGIQDLNDDYNYTRTARYTIVVPVEIDGNAML